MTIKDLRITETEDGVTIAGIADFNPEHTFDCGQCFRWRRQPDGSYIGVAGGRSAQVSMPEDGVLRLDGATEEDFRDFWFDYFDFGRDYSAIKRGLAAKDGAMRAAVEFGGGLRLLKQDFWETLVSFILSSNSNIPKVARSVEVLCREFGEPVSGAVSEGLFAFPEPHAFAEAGEAGIGLCRGGYRCGYIAKTAGMLLSGGFDPERLIGALSCDARAELIRLPGVGPKVADCTLLFSGTCRDVFPIDVWIKRIMETLYLKQDTKPAGIQEFAEGYFGEHRGIAQEYLFYYARTNKEALGL